MGGSHWSALPKLAAVLARDVVRSHRKRTVWAPEKTLARNGVRSWPKLWAYVGGAYSQGTERVRPTEGKNFLQSVALPEISLVGSAEATFSPVEIEELSLRAGFASVLGSVEATLAALEIEEFSFLASS